MPSKSTGVCHEIAPLCHLMAHPLCHQMAPEPVTLLNQSLNQTLSARGQFISEAAKRRIGISPSGEIPFPPAFKPSADHIAIASEKGINIETELLNFRDYHQARGTKLIDWNSAFRVWLRNARVNPLSGRQRSEPDSPHWNSPEGWKDFI